MRVNRRGFTLLEVSIAAAILVITVAGAWAMSRTANVSQQFLWEEWIAHELAISILENACAEGLVRPEPNRSCSIKQGHSGYAEALGDLEATLHIEPANSDDLVELRAEVSWVSIAMPNVPRGTIVRRMQVRPHR